MRSRPQKRRKRTSVTKRSVGRISQWAKTDVGLKREINEDSFLADSDLSLFIVADGMGGHAGGDTASRIAVEVIRDRVLTARQAQEVFTKKAGREESPIILQLLSQAIRNASEKIFLLSNQSAELTGMGTTTTVMLVHGTRGYVAHVGDSRLYQLRNKEFKQLTEDHSLVNEQIKAGFITEEEAQHSRFRNIITRSVGFEKEVTVDTFSMMIKNRDIFLLCSDGLTSMVNYPEINGFFTFA